MAVKSIAEWDAILSQINEDDDVKGGVKDDVKDDDRETETMGAGKVPATAWDATLAKMQEQEKGSIFRTSSALRKVLHENPDAFYESMEAAKQMLKPVKRTPEEEEC